MNVKEIVTMVLKIGGLADRCNLFFKFLGIFCSFFIMIILVCAFTRKCTF